MAKQANNELLFSSLALTLNAVFQSRELIDSYDANLTCRRTLV
jgi:hypothetical protein